MLYVEFRIPKHFVADACPPRKTPHLMLSLGASPKLLFWELVEVFTV